MKHCKKCGQDKPVTDFYWDSHRNAISAPCKSCRIALVVSKDDKWKKDNRERYNAKARKSKIKLKYGITFEEMTNMWIAQDRSCAICKRPISLTASEKASKPHVDHCHVSNVVRGLLCLTCNTGLGMFGDSTDLLDAAKQYLLLRASGAVNTLPNSASVNAA